MSLTDIIKHALPMKLKDGKRHVFPTVTSLVYKRDGTPLENEDGAIEMNVANADKLGGQLPVYYAKQSDYETLVSDSDPQAAKNADKLGGKAPEYYLPAVNLLENSDFRNPINQIGAQAGETYQPDTFFLDRWAGQWDNGCTIVALNDNGLTVTGNFRQIIAAKMTTASPYTIAICYSGNVIRCASGTLRYSADESFLTCAEINDGVIWVRLYTQGGLHVVEVRMIGKNIPIQWIALYEGTYTTNTLPPYIPTHPRVENLKLGNPVQPVQLLDNSDWRIKDNIINQRGKTSYGEGIGIDRWHVWASLTINDGYITVDSIGQRVPKSKFSGAAVTIAAKHLNGNLSVFTIAAPLSVTSAMYGSIFEYHGTDDYLYIGCGGPYDFVWWALYEGTYTAETLPPFVPPDPVVELMKCRRYYKRLSNLSAFTKGNTEWLEIYFPIEPMRVTPTGIVNSASIEGVSLDVEKMIVYTTQDNIVSIQDLNFQFGSTAMRRVVLDVELIITDM